MPSIEENVGRSRRDFYGQTFGGIHDSSLVNALTQALARMGKYIVPRYRLARQMKKSKSS